jgi:WD40 repeat protein
VLELYSTSTGLLGELDLPGDSPQPIDLSFSPDGERVAIHYVGDQEDWAIIDTATLEVITDGGPDEFRRPFLAGDTLYANPPYSDPPTADDLAILRLDPVTFSPVGEPLRGHTGSRWIVMESDELVATSSFDRTVRVWDRASGQQIGREIEIDAPFNLSGDGRRLVTIGPDGITVWNYDIDSWPEIACELAGRNLTATEWEQVGPRTVGYRATCDQYPIDG